jgi:hypothetical protein
MMKISVNKEAVEHLYQCIACNILIVREHIYSNIENDELAAFLNEKLNEVQFHMEQVYNPELIRLKEQARMCYQSWIHLKNTYPDTASAVYVEYLSCRNRIKEIENPF